MTFGQRLRKQREHLALTQQELADRMAMRQAAISRLERDGVPNPGADILKRLARALQCSIDYLVGLYDDAPAPADRRAIRAASSAALAR